MIMTTLIALICAFLYTIKGGSGHRWFRNWNRTQSKNRLLGFVMKPRIFSVLGVFLLGLVGTASLTNLMGDRGTAEYVLDFSSATLLALGYWISFSPSMGEEHGAIGTTNGGWGEYLKWMPEKREIKIFGRYSFTYTEGRAYGIKKAVQRGLWVGAIMAMFTSYMPYLCWSLLYVPCAFVGQELYMRIIGKGKGLGDWVFAEAIIGGIVYGIPTAMYLVDL